MLCDKVQKGKNLFLVSADWKTCCIDVYFCHFLCILHSDFHIFAFIAPVLRVFLVIKFSLTPEFPFYMLGIEWKISFLFSQTTLRSSSGTGRGRPAASSHRRTYTAKSPSSLRLRPTKTKTSAGRSKFKFRCAASQTRWRASRSPLCTFPTTRVSPGRLCLTVNRLDGGKFDVNQSYF